MLPASVAEAAFAHQRTIRQLTLAAIQLLQQALRRAGTSPQAWRDAVAAIGTDLLALQVAAAGLADGYLDDTLTAQGVNTTSAFAVNPDGFADLTDGGGSWLRLLVFAGNSVAPQARGLVANSIVLNGVQDAGRAAVQAGMQARPAVRGYVRMLNPPSCSRCAILAGRVYHSMAAFDRHPRCDCVNVPAAESAEDWTTSPRHYFDSLTAQQQDATFGEAAAQAIRDGADIAQVVNAYSGVTTMRAYGKDVQATTVGTTKRALFGGYEMLADGTLRRRPDSELRKLPGNRYRTATPPRLLPDEIYRLAGELGWDRAEVLRQLRRFGYLR